MPVDLHVTLLTLGGRTRLPQVSLLVLFGAAIGLPGLDLLPIAVEQGLVVGAWLGGVLSDAPALHRRWIGLAITPQAGVALGMALIAGARFPAPEDTIIVLVVGTTVFFELARPILTRLSLSQVGEAGAAHQAGVIGS